MNETKRIVQTKFRKFEDEEIKKQNQRIIEKIIFKTSQLSKEKFLNEYQKNVQYKKNIIKQPDFQDNMSNQIQLFLSIFIKLKKWIKKKEE